MKAGRDFWYLMAVVVATVAGGVLALHLVHGGAASGYAANVTAPLAPPWLLRLVDFAGWAVLAMAVLVVAGLLALGGLVWSIVWFLDWRYPGYREFRDRELARYDLDERE